MILRRIVPNLTVDDASTGQEFDEDFLGLRKEFDLGWVASFRSPDNPSVQVSIVSGRSTPRGLRAHRRGGRRRRGLRRGQRRGYEIVHPLTHEPWGVRRFFVRVDQQVDAGHR